MTCPSTVVYDGYLWGCSMTTMRPHRDHMTDLPCEYADNGQAVLTWGTSWQAAPADTTPRYDGPIYECCEPRRFLPAPVPLAELVTS
ncbi:hypothetical protein C5D04_10115 [Rathayibacter sp. AY1D2]|jgi:hypothetical protein|uniref:hypothetical protein n=1 Tax=unclassified Rathayibacter TaxID=2609250 RepID=UPI000CE86961|nr:MULTISPECIES: hypothetical protein [unclassified Rathayibacter]PPG79284.1 hypothetical protein C5C52_12660 [Rathayibacter sp. AY1E5]PPH18446.1 hypothetical protein C5C99_13645 [Rathayibacter sp. AY1C4]PPI13321.1 hypothetical protein C5D04_10115 [Rathayibacter sp. AY1D2]PPH27143.1 hypothetical protein C5C37_14450 [Rathayibacter sp. AY1F9]PPH43727.1 hypothetical protein C5D09_14535 [Rathayibacter sp. AY1C9]